MLGRDTRTSTSRPKPFKPKHRLRGGNNGREKGLREAKVGRRGTEAAQDAPQREGTDGLSRSFIDGFAEIFFEP